MHVPALSLRLRDIFALPARKGVKTTTRIRRVRLAKMLLSSASCIILVSIALNVFLIREAGALLVVDQKQPVIDATVGGLVVGGSSHQKLAQTVTTGRSGLLTAVLLPIAGDSGDLILEIQGVTASKPNGVVLTSADFAAATLPSFFPDPPTFRSLLLTVPIAFSTGDAFAIVLQSQGSFGVFQGPPGDSYTGGNLFFDALPNVPGWVCNCDFAGESFDLPFQTVVDPSVPEPPVLALVGSGLIAYIGVVVTRRRRSKRPRVRVHR